MCIPATKRLYRDLNEFVNELDLRDLSSHRREYKETMNHMRVQKCLSAASLNG